MSEQLPEHTGRSFFKSLTFKVGFLTSLIMLVVLVVFSAVFIISERQKAEGNIVKNGQAFAAFSADKIYDDYVAFYTQPLPEDFENFKSRVLSTLKSSGDVEEASLMAVNGRVLFDSKEFDEGKYSGAPRRISDEQTLIALQSNRPTANIFTVGGKARTEIIVPVDQSASRHVLSMRYLLNRNSLAAAMRDAYKRMAIVDSILMVFAVTAATLLSFRLTRPIIRLTKVAEQVSGGNFDARADVRGGDELSKLSQALNNMGARLRGYYEDLEAKVGDRTQELEAAQARQLQSIKQDEALLASIGDGVIATDQSGHVVWMNKAAEQILGIESRSVLGRAFDSVWRLETDKGNPVPVQDQPLSQAVKTRQTIRNSNYYYARRDGQGKELTRFAVGLTVAPIMLNGEVIGIINVFRDITQERQIDRMKTEFISLASHQLRTPLSAIRWFAEMLLSGDAGKLALEQEEFVKNISDSTDRMIDLVNSLLNISRIESGRIMIVPKPTDLEELVNGIVNDLKAKTEERHQNLVVSIHKDLPKVNLDTRLIGQVYLNLLTNAIKYTPKGGEISVFISRRGDELVSQITDNGYGIPKQDQAKLFQKFFRAGNIIKVETDGTGLGMYLTKSIIESSGGKIWFESEEGKGSTFWFSLPMTGMKPKKGEVTLDV